jgi:hypothetical protein
MGRAEGVVYINLSQRSERPGKLRFIGLFLCMKPKVLQQQHTAERYLPGHGLDHRSNAVGSHLNGPLEKLAESLSYRLETVFCLGFSFGPAKMRA